MDALTKAHPPTPEIGSERVVVWQRCAFAKDVEASRVTAFSREVLTQVEVHGGEPICQIGSTVVFSFDAIDCDEALELILSLRDTANTTSPQPNVRYGVAVGPLLVHGGQSGQSLEGTVLDRAMTMAIAGSEHEVIVDDTAHERLAEHYLFSRKVEAAPFRGHAVDTATPRKRACYDAVGTLARPPIPQSRQKAFEAMRARADGTLERGVLLRASHAFEALDLLSRVAEQVRPAFQLHLRSQAGGLQPLGSLQAALLDDSSQAELRAAMGALPPDEQQVLRAISVGEAVPRSDAVGAISALLSQPTQAPWVVLHRLHDIDAASLGVLAECRKRLSRPPLLFAVMPEHASAPALLFPAEDRYEVKLGHFPLEERKAMATAILALPADSPIAHRVALLSDPSPLGVVESCRTLVASGDLVQGDAGFRWRVGPRHVQTPIPLETLICERVAGASPLAYRMLEVLSVMPPAASHKLHLRVAEMDGATPQEAQQGLSMLKAEGFIQDDSGNFGPWEATIRSAVRNALPAARHAELHRFIASCLIQNAGDVQVGRGFGSALLAHHQAEGGMTEAAATTLLDAAQDALRCSFQRMAVHLAATAIDLNPSAAIRSQAQRLMDAIDKARRSTPAGDSEVALGGQSLPPPPNTNLAQHALAKAVDAITCGDLDGAERQLDTATAAGGGRGAARRLRAMLRLAQNDAEHAMQVLKQGSGGEPQQSQDPRDALALALIKLSDTDPQGAVRAALMALSSCRKREDSRGEQACLLVLSACYALTGNNAAAEQLQSAATARANAG